VTPWVPCRCDGYWCEIHQRHADECPCPEVEVWLEAGIDPYREVPEGKSLALVGLEV